MFSKLANDKCIDNAIDQHNTETGITSNTFLKYISLKTIKTIQEIGIA